MMRTFSISHNLKDGFSLRLVDTSTVRMAAVAIADSLCALTGHRSCRWYGAVDNWEYNAQRVLLVMALTKEQAFKVSDPKHWDWLEDNDEQLT